MQEIITQLLQSPDKYFWSESNLEQDKIVLGGYDGGRDFGQFEFIINEEFVRIDRSITDGVSSGQMLSPLTFTNQTVEYKQIKDILKAVMVLLSDKDYLAKREFNRFELLQNTFRLLPRYSGIES